MSRILVTGGAGFIGSHVVDGLLSKGYQVRIFDNLFTGSQNNIAHLKDKVELFQGDLRKQEDLDRAMQGVEGVIHLGAMRSVPASLENPKEYYDVNVTGTHNVCAAALKHKVKRVVSISSSSVYGEGAPLPSKEGNEGVMMSPYAISKKAAEDVCKFFSKQYGLETVSLRYFNVFGPRQDPSSQYATAIPLFISLLEKDSPPTIYSDGEQTRDFTHIANVAYGTIGALEAKGPFHGEPINIANGTPVSVNTLVANISRMLNKQHIKPIITGKVRPGDIPHSFADNTRAKELLGYKEVMSLEDGLQQTVDWFVKKN